MVDFHFTLVIKYYGIIVIILVIKNDETLNIQSNVSQEIFFPNFIYNTFNPMSKPIRIEGIDVKIQIIFRQEHIAFVLPQFEKIGLPSSTMDDLINSYIKSGELVSYERWFLEYGQQTLNPLINKKLERTIDHPTFNSLLNYVLKDIIDDSPILEHFKKK